MQRLIKKISFCFFLALLALTLTSNAQTDNVALWIGGGAFTIDPPSDSDSAKVSAYIHAVESAGSPSGTAYGTYMDTPIDFLSLEGIGLGLARSEGRFEINTTIDPSNTPSNPADDVLVKRGKRFASNFVVFLRTIRFVTIGYGFEDGFFVFDTVSSSGDPAQETFSFSYNYLHLSAALRSDSGAYISIVTNFLTSYLSNKKRGNFSGNTNAIIVGWIF